MVGLIFTLPSVYSNMTSLLDNPDPLTSTTIGKEPVIWLPRVMVREVVVAAVTDAATPPMSTLLSDEVAENPVPVMTTEPPA